MVFICAEAARGIARAGVVGVSTDPGVWGVDPPTAGGLSPKAKPDNFWTLECLWRHQITSILQKKWFWDFQFSVSVYSIFNNRSRTTQNTSNVQAFSEWLTASCIVTYVSIFKHGAGIWTPSCYHKMVGASPTPPHIKIHIESYFHEPPTPIANYT